MGDNKEFEPLPERASSKGSVTRVYADPAYDARANFNLLHAVNAQAAIKPRKNTSRNAKCSHLEAKAITAFPPTQKRGRRA